jgi:uncharacterized membrane protein HdeD (DUF308 family)
MQATEPEVLMPNWTPRWMHGDAAPLDVRPGWGWGWMLLRGLAGVLFGLLAILLPGVTLTSLVMVFAAYMLVDGLFAFAAAVHATRAHEPWIWITLEGIANIAVAVVAWTWPALTVLAFVAIAAAWAVISGLFLIFAAINSVARSGRWLIGLGGLVSVVWGVALLVWPIAGALTMVLWVGAYALVFGITFIILAFRMRKGPGVSAAA